MLLNDYAKLCRKEADRWYHDPVTGDRKEMNDGERCMLIVTEISEAFEGLRKDIWDKHLPNRKAAEVEMVDALIRIFDFAGENGFDLDGTFTEKLEYNRTRPDHENGARIAVGGKKF
jgi:hypothetical protein